MSVMPRPFAFLVLLLVPARPAPAQGDPAVIERILDEGKERSHVWETLTYLCEQIGPRLTGSTRLMRANEWTRDEFARLGLKNAHLFKWGEIPVGFDRGPSHVRVLEPSARELEFTARAWSQGTDGPRRGRVRMRPDTLAELERVRADLADAWVLCKPSGGDGLGPAKDTPEARAAHDEQVAIDAALEKIGIAGSLRASRGELVLTDSVRGWRELTMATLPRGIEVEIKKSDSDVLAQELAAGTQLTIEVDLAHRFVAGPVPVYDTVAEIPGREKPEEVVIFSGHLDSWDGPGSQGAQDNGTGSAVMLEAARILMAAGVQPRRTIRFCLWSGEEQGLFGSRGYVESLSEDERAHVSACFVDDGGTNYQGGLMCIASQKEMLDEAIEPVIEAFPDCPMENQVRDHLPRGGASDHASFNQVGIPGFFWSEKGSGGREGKNYEFVHHTQYDTLRYAVPEYLVQSATCSAVVAYQLAEAATLLPRDTSEEAGPAPDPTFRLVEGDFTGEWKVALTSKDAPDFAFTLALEMAQDGRLRGAMSSLMGSVRIADGKWDAAAKSASFAAVTDFGKFEFAVHVEQGVLLGTLGAMGQKSQIRGEPTPAQATPISGRWKGVIASMNAEFTLLFRVSEGGALTGRFQSSQSDSELYGGKWDAAAKSLSFEYDYPHAGRLPVTARLVGAKLVGKIGENAEFEAARSSD